MFNNIRRKLSISLNFRLSCYLQILCINCIPRWVNPWGKAVNKQICGQQALLPTSYNKDLQTI